MNSQKMRDPFFIAVILYESSCSSKDYRPVYEESFVLISAGSEDEALEKATAHAEKQQVSYQNDRGETIIWSLKQVVDVSSCLSDELSDGSEIYVRHFRNYVAYRSFETLLSGEEEE